MEEIYNEYAEVIYNYLLTLTNKSDIAEELLQETFFSAVKNINKFRGDSDIKTWLCKIAKNKYIDYYNKSKKIKEVNIYDCSERYFTEKSFEDDFFNKENLFNTFKKIHKLDEKSKEVVYLRISTNFSFKEIGNIMGKTEQWAKTRFFRAKKILKGDFIYE